MDIPLKVNEMGHYALCVVAFGKGPSCVDRVPNLAASYLEWALSKKRPDLPNSVLRLPLTGDALLRFVPSKDFSACSAVTLGDARDESPYGPREIILKLHFNWDVRGRAGSRGGWWTRRVGTLIC